MKARPCRGPLMAAFLFTSIVFTSIVAAWTHPQPARAFYEPMRFAMPTEESGGGGRFFTGAPGDGFTCGVCHKGPDISLTINGMPESKYVPNQRYRITLSWPADLDLVGLNMEITTRNGTAAGELMTPPRDELLDADMCPPVEAGIPNTGVLPTESGRQIGVTVACGARRATFDWQAPEVDYGPIWFTGSAVHSDEQGSLDGDGVVDFAHVFGSSREPKPLAAEITGKQNGCSLTNAGQRSHTAGLGVLALALLGWRLRRHRRAWRL